MTRWLTAATASQINVAWLALDSGDADLRVFLCHLVSAIQSAVPARSCRRWKTSCASTWTGQTCGLADHFLGFLQLPEPAAG